MPFVDLHVLIAHSSMCVLITYICLQDKVLDALFEIFRISQSKVVQTDSRLTSVPTVDTSLTLDLPSRTRAMRHDLLNNYVSSFQYIFFYTFDILINIS